MIDSRIPLMGAQQQDPFNQLANNIQLGQGLRQLIAGRQIGKMKQLGTPEEQKEFANNSMFGRELNAQLKAEQLTAAKAQQDALKSQAEVDKINSEAFKNTQQGQGYGLDNAGKSSSAIQRSIGFGASTGNKQAILAGLDIGRSTGEIPEAAYQQAVSTLSGLNSIADIKEFGLSVLDPKFSLTTADNRLDNQTSRKNNQETVNATLSGQQVQKEIAQAKLAQDKILAEQELAFKNGEIKEIVTGTDGKAYAVYRDGRVELSRLPDGQQFSPQSKKQNGQPKLSDKALTSVNEMNVQLSTANQNSHKINGLIGDIQSGRLNLSAANQLGAKTKNLIGMSDENSRGVENFQTALNQAVNDVLMMAKGTQTEGDAQRAATVIAANPPRDNAAALQALQRLAAVQQNTISVLDGNINGIYENYGIARPQRNTPKQAPSGADQSKLNSILFGR